MKKTAFTLALCLAVAAGGSASAAPPLLVNGTALEAEACTVYNNTTYVPLREVTGALRPDASVHWEQGRAVASGAGLRLTAEPGTPYIEVNDRALYVRDRVRLEGGRTLVPIRVLGEALGAQVDWDQSTGAVSVSGGGTTGDGSYNSDDLYWLARIISAESRGEPLAGQIAVGNVVLNRVASPDFPNSVYGVIFDNRWGGQFTPVRNGTIYQEPATSSVTAAKLCLEGADIAGSSLYFLAPALAQNHWVMQNRPYITTIGSHWFYA